jgi:hypothetical protein
MERHWCDVCIKGSPVEMRHVRDKKPLIVDTIDHERDFALR